MADSKLKYIQEVLNFSERLSYRAKAANNFRWAENKALILDSYYPDYFDEERLSRFQENYDLLNGNGDSAMKRYSSRIPDELLAEGISPANERVHHYDIISPMLFGLLGEQQSRPMQYRVVDSSDYTQNLLKFKRVKFMQEYLLNQHMPRIQSQAVNDWMLQNNVTDLLQLNPDQQVQFESDIQQRVKEETPESFDRFLRKGFKSPREIQGTKLLEFLERELELKFITDEGFKHALVTGEEVYYVGIQNGKPIVEWVNPMNFFSVGAPENMFVQQDEWAKRVRWSRPSDIWNRHASKFKRSDIPKLNAIFERARGSHDKRGPALESVISQVIGEIDISDQLELQGIDLRTREGQLKYYSLLARNSKTDRVIETVREAHFVWKSLRKVKEITRVLEDGTARRFYIDESYRFNPTKGDIKEDILWIPEVYQTTMIGEIDPVFVDKGPLPNQHRSLKNPYDCTLPYKGALYNKHAGNTENVAPIDRSKKWQHLYNLQMARIKEMEATDIGRVLLMTLAARPEGWSWGKFIEVIRYAKIAPIDLKKEGIDASDAQFFKSIDLSNLYDILPRLNLLTHLRDMAALSLTFNSSRFGDPSPFTTVANNNQNILRAVNQSKHISIIHDKIVEQVLNALYDTARVAYQDNPFYARYILDDLSITELELDTELLKSAEIGVHVVNSGEEFANVEIAKELLLPLIQTGNLSAPAAIRLLWAKSKAEILNFAEESELEKQLQAAQAMDMQTLTIEQQQEFQKELITLQEEVKRLTEREKSASKERMAWMNSMLMANAQDIDKNQIPDSLQRDRQKLALEGKIHQDESRQKDRELDIKQQEADTKRIAAQKKSS